MFPLFHQMSPLETNAFGRPNTSSIVLRNIRRKHAFRNQFPVGGTPLENFEPRYDGSPAWTKTRGIKNQLV